MRIAKSRAWVNRYFERVSFLRKQWRTPSRCCGDFTAAHRSSAPTRCGWWPQARCEMRVIRALFWSGYVRLQDGKSKSFLDWKKLVLSTSVWFPVPELELRRSL